MAVANRIFTVASWFFCRCGSFTHTQDVAGFRTMKASRNGFGLLNWCALWARTNDGTALTISINNWWHDWLERHHISLINKDYHQSVGLSFFFDRIDLGTWCRLAEIHERKKIKHCALAQMWVLPSHTRPALRCLLPTTFDRRENVIITWDRGVRICNA